MFYVNEIRVQKAMKLLRDMNYTIVDIAERIGYNDYKYFSRKFKEIAKI